MIKKDEYINILDVDFNISHNIDDTFIMNNCHFHNVFEIYFAQTEGIKFFINNQIYPVEMNDVFIFNNLDLHRIVLPKGIKYERNIITFNPIYIESLCSETTNLLDCFVNRNVNFCHRAKLFDEQSLKFLSLISKAQKIPSDDQFGIDILRKLVLAEILILINQIFQSNTISISTKHNEEYLKIKPILSYINNNINNKFHLCKLFKTGTGMTINEYLIFKRIILASELLRKNYSVSVAAKMAGFVNECHFITTFKRIVGITPKQYSKKFSVI